MPTLTVEGFSPVDVETGKRLVLAIEQDAKVDILHACGGNARCTTCRVEFISGEPPRMTLAEKSKMEEKGLVEHRTEGRTFIYRPIVSEQEVSKSMTHDLLDRLFEGSVASLLSHLLSTREVSAGEVKELEQLLKEKKARK